MLAYVGLTAQVTAQTYRLAALESRQNELLQTKEELRQHLQVLQSMPRLEAIAAKLHMAEPGTIAVIRLPSPRSEAKGASLAARLPLVSRWLTAR